MNSNFLQSPQWMRFQQESRRKCWRIGNEEWQGLVIKYVLPFKKSYLYCPYGPFVKSDFVDKIKPHKFLDEVEKIAKQENAIFFRCDSRISLGLENFGFKKAPQDYYFSATALPKEVAILDISGDEGEILKTMKQKTRYNIHLAEKKGIKIKQSQDVDIFYNLICKTSQREKIRPHPKEHYQRLLESFNGSICLFLAFFGENPIAGIIVLFFEKTATYLHGGSDSEYRHLMAPYLLHWTAIKEAKKRDCQEYDFGGISLEPKHPWSGITRFKLNFGAKPVVYPGAYDLIFQPFWYYLYSLVRKFRR